MSKIKPPNEDEINTHINKCGECFKRVEEIGEHYRKTYGKVFSLEDRGALKKHIGFCIGCKKKLMKVLFCMRTKEIKDYVKGVRKRR